MAWFEDNKKHLPGLVEKAEEPAMFYAAMRALEAVERGEPKRTVYRDIVALQGMRVPVEGEAGVG